MKTIKVTVAFHAWYLHLIINEFAFSISRPWEQHWLSIHDSYVWIFTETLHLQCVCVHFLTGNCCVWSPISTNHRGPQRTLMVPAPVDLWISSQLLLHLIRLCHGVNANKVVEHLRMSWRKMTLCGDPWREQPNIGFLLKTTALQANPLDLVDMC